MSEERASKRATRTSPGRIVVMGYIIRGPIGGMTWHYLNYVAGFARMGWDVLFVEDSDDYESCYDPERHIVSADATYGLAYADAVFSQIGLPDCWAYFDAHTSRWHGPRGSQMPDLARDADILLSVSGINPVRDWMLHVPVRVLLDTDPAFTQIKHLQNESQRQAAASFTHYFSFGENIGKASCSIPDDGIAWHATRQPIDMNLWQHSGTAHDAARYTTVMQWDSYDTLTYRDRDYGMKSTSFEPYFHLPGSVSAQLEIALGSPDAPRESLREAGWHITNPLSISKDPVTYRDYIGDSAGEFSVAKHGYVATNSGWFSERSACYLASGRPVILQDTGFSEVIPTGSGLFAFTTVEEATDALDACDADRAHHSHRARELAAAYFDSGVVLRQLLASLG